MKKRNGFHPSAKVGMRELISQKLQQALSLHQAGNFIEAELVYGEILATEPDHFDALQFSGLVAYQTHKFAIAETFFIRAIRVRSDVASVYSNFALLLQDVGRFNDAIASYDRAIALQPDYVDVHYNRGVLLQELKRFEEALGSYEMAIMLKPYYGEALYNRGVVFQELGRMDDAVASYEQAISIQPRYVEAYSNLGNALIELKQFEKAVLCYDQATSVNANYAEAYSNRGNALNELGRFDEGLINCDQAIALNPGLFEAYSNRGNSLKALARFEESVDCYLKAISIKADFVEAYSNLANALGELRRFDEAIAACFQGASKNPAFPGSYYNISHFLLITGQLRDGFDFYEWRKRLKEPYGSRMFPQPLWLGRESLVGKRILVHEEQGFGDVIQFCRYLKLFEAAGAKVTFAVRNNLMTLMRGLGAGVEICSVHAVPTEFDYHCPLLSLPLAFKTDLSSIPVEDAYLGADAARVQKWGRTLGADGFKIGICWQGSTEKVDRGRSFPVTQFREIAQIPGVRLISLHKGGGEAQLAGLPDGMRVETLGNDFDSGSDAFLDTAAVMKCCDLVITSDTAVAHLAGALGVKTWVALKFLPDWRWLLDRSDSPWYPNTRLFRQETHGDWAGVFAKIEQAILSELPEDAQTSQGVD